MFFTSVINGALTIACFFECLGVALVCGLIVAFANFFLGTRSKNMFVAVAVLPMIVSIVVILVNGIVQGALGTGIAIAGAFALVRFRSVPGTAKEIAVVFLAMALGIACGMGYLLLGFLATIFITAVIILLSLTPFGNENGGANDLKITIPENLDYTEIFDDVFKEYTRFSRLEKIKTINLGTMIELKYRIVLKDKKQEKAFVDAIRVRNGNLTVILSRGALRDELSL